MSVHDSAANRATQLLAALSGGDRQAQDELLALLYDELHALAQGRMARERPDHTLQATVLVHDVWSKLMGDERARWESRGQFLGVAAQAMRRLLVNHARDRRAAKRGGGAERASLDLTVAAVESQSEVDLLALEDAMQELARRHPELARIVELRFFAGLSVDQIAEAMELAPRTVDRRWSMAKGFLHTHLSEGEEA